MGAETLLHLVADGRELRAVVNRRVRPTTGEQVHVRLRPSQVHIFDAAGGRIPAESTQRAGAA
jgi:ABC-type sugar transport system ATPase subunit